MHWYHQGKRIFNMEQFHIRIFSKDRYRKLNAIQCTLFKDKKDLILLFIKIIYHIQRRFCECSAMLKLCLFWMWKCWNSSGTTKCFWVSPEKWWRLAYLASHLFEIHSVCQDVRLSVQGVKFAEMSHTILDLHWRKFSQNYTLTLKGLCYM